MRAGRRSVVGGRWYLVVPGTVWVVGLRYRFYTFHLSALVGGRVRPSVLRYDFAYVPVYHTVSVVLTLRYQVRVPCTVFRVRYQIRYVEFTRIYFYFLFSTARNSRGCIFIIPLVSLYPPRSYVVQAVHC